MSSGLVISRADDFPHRVELQTDRPSETAAMWCVERFGPRNTYAVLHSRHGDRGVWDRFALNVFRFESADDAFEFKMRFA